MSSCAMGTADNRTYPLYIQLRTRMVLVLTRNVSYAIEREAKREERGKEKRKKKCGKKWKKESKAIWLPEKKKKKEEKDKTNKNSLP